MTRSLFRGLRWILRGQAPQARGVCSAAAGFGKHPGWDDHIEDLGELDDDVLIALKRGLYDNGIVRNVDAGSWQNLTPLQRLDKFDHVFLGAHGTSLVAGRMWSSVDGRGRSSYPMVVVARCDGVSPEWVTTHALAALDELRAQCIATTASADVRAAVASTSAWIKAQTPDAAGLAAPSADELLRGLAARPEFGPEREGLHRVLYHLDREIGIFGQKSTNGVQRGHAVAIRVPLLADLPMTSAMTQWLTILRKLVPSKLPLLLVAPLGHRWLDAIVAQPDTATIFCLRATLEAVPKTSEIPYELDAPFIDRAERLFG